MSLNRNHLGHVDITLHIPYWPKSLQSHCSWLCARWMSLVKWYLLTTWFEPTPAQSSVLSFGPVTGHTWSPSLPICDHRELYSILHMLEPFVERQQCWIMVPEPVRQIPYNGIHTSIHHCKQNLNSFTLLQSPDKVGCHLRDYGVVMLAARMLCA